MWWSACPIGRPLTSVPAFSLRAGDRVLLSGRSGAGKTTILRAFSGVWPYGEGKVEVPDGTRTLVLPQRSYLPQGTLRQALCYPGTLDAYPDAAVRDAWRPSGSAPLADDLDRADNWSQRLSGGEQQRVGVARAILSKPDWLFLDEATGALDEAGETALYQTLIERLPEAGIVSITHRPTLDAFHNRRVEMQRGALRAVPGGGSPAGGGGIGLRRPAASGGSPQSGRRRRVAYRKNTTVSSPNSGSRIRPDQAR